MPSIIEDLFNLFGQPASVIDFLDTLPYDELVEIDIPNNNVRNLFHVDGKYFVPIIDGTYKDLYQYSNDYMIHPDDRRMHTDFMNHDTILDRLEAAEVPGLISAEFRYRLQNDDWRWVHQIVIGGSQHNLPEGVIRFYVFDIQSLKDRELDSMKKGERRSLTHHDNLTGLPREKDFFSQVSDRLESQDLTNWCMIAVDIEEFKLLNDWYGRKTGDYILSNIGAYFSECVEERGWLAGYFGQDDFCVLMYYDEGLVKEIYDDICEIIMNYGSSMSFTPAIGVSLVEDSLAPLDLLDRAKLALESAKGDYKHHIRIFEPYMFKETADEYRMLAEFEQALKNNDIYYVVQPQCRVKTGNIVGVEALARWRKPDGSIVDPERFVHMLEKFGFITDLDCYLWESVCRDIKEWIDAGHIFVPVSVNVSRHDIYNIDVCDHLIKLTERYGVPRSAFKIEITESAYVDDVSKVGKTVEMLRESGFTVLMDDFGSGYSSLNVLDTLSVDVIKLDMCFLQMDDTAKRKSIRIIESVVNMAKMLNILVIAEGVESREQAEFLHSIGCDYVQGYHFYRPLEVGELKGLIIDGSLIDESGFAFKRNEEFRIREILDQNIYSDAMLNGMLGAIGLYEMRDGEISITRFNQRFYEEVGIDEFDNQTASVQEFVHPADRERSARLFEAAEEDELNGAGDLIRFCRPDGAVAFYRAHVYFLHEKEGVKEYYGTVRNVSGLYDLSEKIELLSNVSDGCAVFITRRRGALCRDVGVFGLEKHLGISRQQLQSELDDLSILERVRQTGETGILRSILDGSPVQDKNVSLHLQIKTSSGEFLPATVNCHCIDDEWNSIQRVIAFHLE